MEATKAYVPAIKSVYALPKDALGQLVAGLGKFGTVYGPVAGDAGTFSFSRVTDASELRLDYQRTILPPKKFFMPPENQLYRFSPEKGYVPADAPQERKVLFGLHPCDIHGILLLDRVFTGENADPRYAMARAATVIVGLDCAPDDLCFCGSMGTGSVETGFDLFLTDIGDVYFIRAGTVRGEEMLAAAGAARPVTAVDVSKYKEFIARRNRAPQRTVETANLPQVIETDWDSPVWEEAGKDCLACGSCSASCPTCHCYWTIDSVDLGAPTGTRTQRWDSCLFKDFSTVAGGHDFRPTQGSRLRYWYNHKLMLFPREYGRPGCVGCGRCIAVCPAGIDITEVLAKLKQGQVADNDG